MTEIFISYSSHDAAVAQAVCAALEAASFPCWIAPRNIRAGQEYGAAIIDGINRARLIVLVLSTHSHSSPQVLREIERGVSKGVPILPLRIDDVALSGSMEYFLSTQHWLDAQAGPLEGHLPLLVTTVSSLIPRTATPPAEPEPPRSMPETVPPVSRETVSKELGVAEGVVLQGRYRLVRVLGQGGMGQVWLAEDQTMDDDPFALKFLPPALWNDEGARACLKQEARAAMKLSHPNLVRLMTFEPGPPLFLVMEYVEGTTLAGELARRRAKEGGMAPHEVVPFLHQIAAGLHESHQNGLIHRDIKPSNILLQRKKDGSFVAKLGDFGIAAEVGSFRTRLTGQIAAGTLCYMSPEQQACDKLDPRTDIYSLGATLYEMLSLSPPFIGGNVAWAIMHSRPRPIENVPAAVNEVVLRALAKDPGARQSTALELAAEFQRAVDQAPAEARIERSEVVAPRTPETPQWPQTVDPGSPAAAQVPPTVAPQTPQPELPRTTAPQPHKPLAAGFVETEASVMTVTGLDSVPKKPAPRSMLGLRVTLLALIAGVCVWIRAHHPQPPTVEKTAPPATVESAPRATPAPGFVPSPSVAATRLTTEEYNARLAALQNQTPHDDSDVSGVELWERRAQRMGKRSEEIRHLLDHAPDAPTRSPLLDKMLQGRPARETVHVGEYEFESDEVPGLNEAKSGEAGAMYNLARLYWWRWDLHYSHDPSDAAQAKEWLEKAQAAGFIKAQTLAAVLRKEGFPGFSKDQEEIVRLWRKASREGDGEASRYLGDAYEVGSFGLKKSKKEMFRMYRLAVDQGFLGAAGLLGNCYLNGEGTEKDEKAAIEIFKLGVLDRDERSALGA